MNKQEIDLGQMDISVKILGTIIVFQKKKKKGYKLYNIYFTNNHILSIIKKLKRSCEV